jgi:hypothetical protein
MKLNMLLFCCFSREPPSPSMPTHLRCRISLPLLLEFHSHVQEPHIRRAHCHRKPAGMGFYPRFCAIPLPPWCLLCIFVVICFVTTLAVTFLSFLLPYLLALTDSVPSPSPHPGPGLIPGGCEVDIARSCDSLQQVLRHMYVCLCASVDACI